MLSSIHPLGERGRNNRWAITVVAFALAAVLTGAAVGAGIGSLGGLVLGSLGPSAAMVAIGSAAIASVALDVSPLSPPSTKRQVNEYWIGRYRGWVYGAAFGSQLGLGVATYVVSWGVYAMLAAEFLVASPASGAFIGSVFGLGRSLSLLAAGTVTTPSELTTFHRLMARLGLPVRRASVALTGMVGIAAMAGGIL